MSVENVGPKKSFAEKNIRKIFWSKNFGRKIFWSKKVWSKNIWSKKLVENVWVEIFELQKTHKYWELLRKVRKIMKYFGILVAKNSQKCWKLLRKV